jgi:hypothetical protein
MPAKGVKKWLTQEQECVVREAYAKGATCREAAFLAGVTVFVLAARLEDQVRDLRRGRGRGGRRGPAVDPTPEEIAIRRAEVDARRLRVMRPKAYNPDDLT